MAGASAPGGGGPPRSSEPSPGEPAQGPRRNVTRVRPPACCVVSDQTCHPLTPLRKAVKATLVLLPLLGITYMLFFVNPGEDDLSQIVFIYFNSFLQSFQVGHMTCWGLLPDLECSGTEALPETSCRAGGHVFTLKYKWPLAPPPQGWLTS